MPIWIQIVGNYRLLAAYLMMIIYALAVSCLTTSNAVHLLRFEIWPAM